MDMIQKLVECVEKLESNQTVRQPPKPSAPAPVDGPPKSSNPILSVGGVDKKDTTKGAMQDEEGFRETRHPQRQRPSVRG